MKLITILVEQDFWNQPTKPLKGKVEIELESMLDGKSATTVSILPLSKTTIDELQKIVLASPEVSNNL